MVEPDYLNYIVSYVNLKKFDIKGNYLQEGKYYNRINCYKKLGNYNSYIILPKENVNDMELFCKRLDKKV